MQQLHAWCMAHGKQKCSKYGLVGSIIGQSVTQPTDALKHETSRYCKTDADQLSQFANFNIVDHQYVMLHTITARLAA
jgi:hypothetical protein